ncbi:MAG: sigma-70 family RNA polymerase sigma factor, partial [Planctomycetota bacterium]|nr:sigma-70 family RNA polymerase sigma factor [Planctomycetota bacterium]
SVVAAANPASILVAIGCRMGHELRQRLAPEDVWQETLLKAWQARADFEWQDVATFRHWLLRIAQHCIEDLRDHDRAKKRDSRRTTAMAPASRSASSASPHAYVIEPWGSTTPSRIAVDREKAEAMEKALQSLPYELRDVVRLRLFDDLSIAEIATSLGLGESAVRHRFRAGAEVYRARLRTLLEATSVGDTARGRETSRARNGESETGDGSAVGFR